MEWHRGDHAAALESQQTCEKLIKEWGDVATLKALKHISSSALAYLKYQSGCVSECYDILGTIVPYEELDDKNKACVSGIRAWVLFQFGYDRKNHCAEQIAAALQLDPDCAEWHFLHAKFLMRYRKAESPFSIPDTTEIEEFEQSARMSNCAGYDATVGYIYQEVAKKLYVTKTSEPGKVNEICKKSEIYYREALKKVPNSVNINVRCAEGFLKLPHAYRNINFAKECLDRALRLAPNNSLVHHIMGLYYERNGDYEKAKEFYKSAGDHGSFGAFMDLMNLEFRTTDEYDPVPLCDLMYNRFKSSYQRGEVALQLASYYHLRKNNLKEAISWLLKCEYEHAVRKLKKFRPSCGILKYPIDMLTDILQKTSFALENKNISLEDTALYKDFISKYGEMAGEEESRHKLNFRREDL